jgi:hypothetical protein
VPASAARAHNRRNIRSKTSTTTIPSASTHAQTGVSQARLDKLFGGRLRHLLREWSELWTSTPYAQGGTLGAHCFSWPLSWPLQRACAASPFDCLWSMATTLLGSAAIYYAPKSRPQQLSTADTRLLNLLVKQVATSPLQISSLISTRTWTQGPHAI